MRTQPPATRVAQWNYYARNPHGPGKALRQELLKERHHPAVSQDGVTQVVHGFPAFRFMACPRFLDRKANARAPGVERNGTHQSLMLESNLWHRGKGVFSCLEKYPAIDVPKDAGGRERHPALEGNVARR